MNVIERVECRGMENRDWGGSHRNWQGKLHQPWLIQRWSHAARPPFIFYKRKEKNKNINPTQKKTSQTKLFHILNNIYYLKRQRPSKIQLQKNQAKKQVKTTKNAKNQANLKYPRTNIINSQKIQTDHQRHKIIHKQLWTNYRNKLNNNVKYLKGEGGGKYIANNNITENSLLS